MFHAGLFQRPPTKNGEWFSTRHPVFFIFSLNLALKAGFGQSPKMDFSNNGASHGEFQDKVLRLPLLRQLLFVRCCIISPKKVG
jgi:hypothetical protein